MSMLRKFASTSTLRTVFRNNTPVRSVAGFHSAPTLKQEDKEAVAAVVPEEKESESILSDWKIAAPIGIAIGIPALSNGFYVLNEESQLACCFLLFCTSAYKFGGDMVASYFDEKSNVILAEHNAVEDANIAMAKEALVAHQNQLGIFEDVAALEVAQKEVVKLLCETESAKLKHEMRDTFVKNLDAMMTYESAFQVKMQEAMVKYATEKVRDEVVQGGKTVREAAFNTALNVLSDPNALKDKEDDIAKLFSKHLNSYSADIESKVGTTVKLSPEQVKEMQGEFDIYMKRYNLEGAELKAPKELKLQLLL